MRAHQALRQCLRNRVLIRNTGFEPALAGAAVLRRSPDATQPDVTKPFGGACGRSTVVGGNDIFAWYCNLWRESKVRKTGISAFCCTRPDTDRVIATR